MLLKYNHKLFLLINYTFFYYYSASQVVEVICLVCSIVCLQDCTIYLGSSLSPRYRVLRTTQSVFLVTAAV